MLFEHCRLTTGEYSLSFLKRPWSPGLLQKLPPGGVSFMLSPVFAER